MKHFYDWLNFGIAKHGIAGAYRETIKGQSGGKRKYARKPKKDRYLTA